MLSAHSTRFSLGGGAWGTSRQHSGVCSAASRLINDRHRILFQQQWQQQRRCGGIENAAAAAAKAAAALHFPRAAAAAESSLEQQTAAAASASSSAVSYAVLVGFAPDEADELNAYCADVWPDTPLVFVPVADGGDGNGNSGGVLLDARVDALLDVVDDDDDDGSSSDGKDPAGPLVAAAARAAAAAAPASADNNRQQQLWGRAVFFLGGPARALAAAVGEALVEDLGQRPAIVAAAHAGAHGALSLRAALAAVRAAHAQYHDLVQPVVTTLEGGAAPPPLREPPTLALNCVIDRGTVAMADGGTRDDEACVVAIDGLLSADETASLLAWLDPPTRITSVSGDDGATVSSSSKWERACVDRPGGAPTYGLRASALAALRAAPPPAAVTLQARLQALYPEYIVAHMPPSTALLGDEDDDGDDDEDGDDGGGAPPPLSAHVANAVLPGDPCAWHLDMDPWALPLHSSFAEHVGGAYVNRDPRRPRFVSALVYLNTDWPEDGHAETLFADPLTGSGVFVQPRQGRVVLMDQDAPHRIGSPAAGAAPAPRYSLVWKLVFWPRLLSGGGSGSGGGGIGPSSDALLLPPPLCRPEWGAPQRIGSAAGLPVQVDVSSC